MAILHEIITTTYVNRGGSSVLVSDNKHSYSSRLNCSYSSSCTSIKLTLHM